MKLSKISKYKLNAGKINNPIGFNSAEGDSKLAPIILVQILFKNKLTSATNTTPPSMFPYIRKVKLINGEKFDDASKGLRILNKYLNFLYMNPMMCVPSQLITVAAKIADKLVPIGAKPTNESIFPKIKKANNEIK
jgi:hypothetical protein